MSVELKSASVVRTGNAILDQASVQCVASQFTALCGPNGAGKTTALSLMTGAFPPDRGGVFFHGQSVKNYKPIDLARRRAVVSQASVLNFPFQVHEVVAMGRTPHLGISSLTEDADIISEAIALMDLQPFAERNYLTLSGGERQRVNIARALAQVWDADKRLGHPPWLFLDEPTAALDLKYQLALMDLLRRLAASGWGIVAVLHDLHLVNTHADHVVLFNSGRIHSASTPAEALTPERIQEVYALEAPFALTA